MTDSIAVLELTELVTLNYGGTSADAPAIGDSDTYYTELIDDEGCKIGTLTGSGKIEYRRPTDDHLMIHYKEELVLSDGNLQIDGWIDGNAIRAGNWVTLDAKGTSGRYTGWTGVRMLRIKEPHKLMQTSIFLFG